MPPESTPNREKRRIKRLSISLPVRIAGIDPSGAAWNEMSRTIDISAFGAGFRLKRPVERGKIVKFSLAMPQRLRSYDFMGTQYNIWGVITGCEPDKTDANNETYHLGAAFIGKNPPPTYIENPSQLFQIQFDGNDGTYRLTPVDRIVEDASRPEVYRQHSRYEIPISVVLEVVNADGNVERRESTVMENISLSGAAIFSSLELEIGSEIRVISDQYNASLKAVLRGKRKGEDGIPRLHVEFIDGLFPLEGIDIDY